VDPKAAGAAISSLDRPLVNEEGECSFLCRGEFGRAPRGLLAGGALEALATLWPSMTAREVQKIFFLEVYTSYMTGHSFCSMLRHECYDRSLLVYHTLL